MQSKVAIVWRYLADYRIPFYRGLREYLAERDIELNVIFGRTEPGLGETECRLLPWAKRVDDWRLHVAGFELCWQPYGACLRDADLVIVEQANRLLLNYWLIAKRRLSRQKVAFWGHGRDLQTPRGTIRNAWKRLFINQVDWWFAYSEEVKALIAGSGFLAERITNVQNAIDTDGLRSAKKAFLPEQLESLRRELGLGNGPIGIYCGRLYKDKRINFLLEACFVIRSHIKNFEVIIAGAGPDQGKIIAAAREAKWIHYVGQKLGYARVPYFLVSDVTLMPAAVGLAVVDCFALEVPLITTRFPNHGPEVAYLKSGENGLITEDDLEKYVTGVTDTLLHREHLARLKRGCRAAAHVYTMRAMVENFGSGIVACLSAARPALFCRETAAACAD